MGTHWEQQKPNTPLPSHKRKKIEPIGCMFVHLISDYYKFLQRIFILYHFWPRLMAKAQIPIVRLSGVDVMMKHSCNGKL